MHNGRVHRVHRDIKPGNILLDRHGEIKLSDFGLARDKSGQSKLSTHVAGTMRYYSPEVVNEGKQSEKSDIWAFGVVVLELAYGRDAFAVDKIQGLKPKKIISIFEKKGGYSKEMAVFLSRCFERKSDNRAKITDLLLERWFDKSCCLKSKSAVNISEISTTTNMQTKKAAKKLNTKTLPIKEELKIHPKPIKATIKSGKSNLN